MDSIPDFTNKIVTFSTTDSTLALSNPQFEIQGGRLFVLGTVPNGSTINNWAEGRTCAVAWDAVTDYMVFDTVKQYVDLLAKSEAEQSD